MNDTEERKGRDLNDEEKAELRKGQQIYEMTQTAGWKIVEQWLKDRAYHSWVDPRETSSKDEWDWRELNAFHSADVSKQIIEEISRMVAKVDYLEKVMSGEITDAKKFRI